MTIVMSSKNQITIPRKLIKALQLPEKALFDISLNGNRLELIPVETIERTFTNEEYVELEKLYQKEKHLSEPITEEYIENL